ncbi:MAG: type I 3-dehydroquinate dehydratase [Treponema sp.]|nr:type I 3-dehydroquinate dehydratase [Treponema sp.]
MAKICLCLTGKTLAQDLEILNQNRTYTDLVELRADYLAPDERLLLRRFPEMAGVPVILSIRRGINGGEYLSGEGSRITLLAKGLAYADADRRRNFAYVDLEEDLDVPSLEEAARAFGTRIIRSCYNLEGVIGNLPNRLKHLKRVGDELVKAVVMPRSLDDVIEVLQASREMGDLEKIISCVGEYASISGILAEHFGSRITYTYPAEDCEARPPAAHGQISPKELAEQYRFPKITVATKVFAVAGYPLKSSPIPRFFNTIFAMEKNDAVHIPVPADSLRSLLRFAGELGISALSITTPYKEEVLLYAGSKSAEVLAIGACNALTASQDTTGRWTGFNTEARAFSDSLLTFIGRKDFRRRKITIIGAGSAAQAAAFEVHRLKGKALILNRIVGKARTLAEQYHFAWAGLDSRGADLMEKYSDIIIQASSVGSSDNPGDPIEFYRFSGRETLMDTIFTPEKTLCVRRAEDAGCRVLTGSDMLVRQLRYHYTHITGKEFPPSLISRVGVYYGNGTKSD